MSADDEPRYVASHRKSRYIGSPIFAFIPPLLIHAPTPALFIPFSWRNTFTRDLRRKALTGEMREEPVRQWCAHELMRSYGYPIKDLSFEERVKVGSKTYRIDILVRRGNAPWLVVECKEPEYVKHEHAMEQAVSYAAAESVKAEFALYTNGKVWKAKRCVSGLWTPVADIPYFDESRANGSIDDLLLTMEVLMPLLHKLDERLEGSDAQRFLEALQRFFYGRNLLTRSNDQDLCFATDNILRVLSVGMNDLPYSAGKLSSAGQGYERYRKRTGIGQAFCLPLLWRSSSGYPGFEEWHRRDGGARN